MGTPLPWAEAKQYASYVRDQGIEQLIRIYNNSKDKQGDVLLWGDEVEYMVVSVDDKNKTSRLSLRQAEILAQLADQEKQGKLEDADVTYHPEYGRYMLEATPATPFTGSSSDLLKVQKNMDTRRSIAKNNLLPNEIPLTFTSFPRLGAPDQFTEPYHPPTGPASRSFFLPDEIINPHARFPTLTANIRERRGSKVAINVPIYFDENTPKPFVDPTIPRNRGLYPEDAQTFEIEAPKKDHIYMDSMGFGMGCSCLQLTFQATNINEARNLYDQLIPVAPIMLALTAASPCYRGYLSDQDTRWNVIAGSVDDRTAYERGLEPAPKGFETDNSDIVIPKSRYDSVDSYLAFNDPLLTSNESHYNDTKLVVNEKILKKLKDAGFDDLFAKHFAHLFIRDPLVIFRELLKQDNETSSDHFENIQSTNWQTIRFKPPPPGSSIGWRVEFRPMEVQITDFENASFTIFIVLLTRVILSYNLNFYLPISKVDENMKVAHHRNGILEEKFWFRTDIFRDPADFPTSNQTSSSASKPSVGKYEKLSIDEIINGSKEFTGLIPIVRRYLRGINVDLEMMCELEKHLSLVSKRASGQLKSNASWIREFIASHPNYKHDSVISNELNYDLTKALEKITNGEGWDSLAKSMLGGF